MSFNASLETTNNIAKLTLSGELDASTAPLFQAEVDKALTENTKRLVLLMQDLDYMASAGLRVLIHATRVKQRMGSNADIYIVGAQDMVMETIQKAGFHHSAVILDEYDAAQIENV